MEPRLALLLHAVGAVGLFSSGCGCFIQAQRGETAAPPPAQPVVREKVVIRAAEPKTEEQVAAVAAQSTEKVVVPLPLRTYISIWRG